jgi:hypothetical protein
VEESSHCLLFKVLYPSSCLGVVRKTTIYLSVGIGGSLPKIQIEYLPHTRLQFTATVVCT